MFIVTGVLRSNASLTAGDLEIILEVWSIAYEMLLKVTAKKLTSSSLMSNTLMLDMDSSLDGGLTEIHIASTALEA